MPILTATNVSHHFGQRMILDKLSLTIEPGQRLGIVGRNGCGKSTFLKIMAGIMKCDTGTIALQRSSRVGYLHQDFTLDPTDTLRGAAEAAFEGLHDLHKQLNDVYHHMGDADADIDKLLKKQAQLETEIEAAGGY